jgi:hypothetical protein
MCRSSAACRCVNSKAYIIKRINVFLNDLLSETEIFGDCRCAPIKV